MYLFHAEALHKAIKKRTFWRTKLIISSLEIKINACKIELNKYLENINLIVDSVTLQRPLQFSFVIRLSVISYSIKRNRRLFLLYSTVKTMILWDALYCTCQ